MAFYAELEDAITIALEADYTDDILYILTIGGDFNRHIVCTETVCKRFVGKEATCS